MSWGGGRETGSVEEGGDEDAGAGYVGWDFVNLDFGDDRGWVRLGWARLDCLAIRDILCFVLSGVGCSGGEWKQGGGTEGNEGMGVHMLSVVGF